MVAYASILCRMQPNNISYWPDNIHAKTDGQVTNLVFTDRPQNVST